MCQFERRRQNSRSGVIWKIALPGEISSLNSLFSHFVEKFPRDVIHSAVTENRSSVGAVDDVPPARLTDPASFDFLIRIPTPEYQMDSHKSLPAIISFGEVLWDLFPEGARFGGAPANFACHAAALGGDVTMVSAVGVDDRGREAIEILHAYGIHTDLIPSWPDAPTGTVGIELDGDGKPTFAIHEGSAWDQLNWTEEMAARIQRADAVYFGTLGQRSEASRATITRALKVAADAGISRVLDVNLRAPFFDDALVRESVSHASILKLSDDEIEKVSKATEVDSTAGHENSLRQLLERYQLDLVVMTRGAEGALLVSPDRTIDQPGIPTTVLDTVGAGDAFIASFCLGLLRGEAHDQILRKSCELAAEVCAHRGAIPDPEKRF